MLWPVFRHCVVFGNSDGVWHFSIRIRPRLLFEGGKGRTVGTLNFSFMVGYYL